MATNTRLATGLHTLVLLARQPDSLLSSETIAATLETNAVVIRRILAQLQQAGLVRNHKGPYGGSQLLRPASELTLADVYKAIEHAPMFSDAAVGGPDAKRVTLELRRVLSLAEKQLLHSLGEVSLQQMVRGTGRKKA